MVKAVILAGGFGSRLSEETSIKPKPMVTIGNQPILWHIMKLYDYYNITDFIICTGYKGHLINDYFKFYKERFSSVTFDLGDGSVVVHEPPLEKWNVTIVNTGLTAMTGGRLLGIKQFLDDNEPFFMTYGDGVSDVNIEETLKFHLSHGKLATVTGIIPPGRFGILQTEANTVTEFSEKPNLTAGRVNGGFFVLQKAVLDYIADASTPFEMEPLQKLAKDGELFMFPHNGFWHAMDTLRDCKLLRQKWSDGAAEWKVWSH